MMTEEVHLRKAGELVKFSPTVLKVSPTHLLCHQPPRVRFKCRFLLLAPDRLNQNSGTQDSTASSSSDFYVF